MEVIELVSDEELPNNKVKNAKISKTCNTNCINFKCNSGVDMKPAPSFACAYYGINTEKRKRPKLICKQCFNMALEHQKQLVAAFLDQKSLLRCNFPDHTVEVEISDSDESDDEKKKELDENNTYLPTEVLLDLEEKLDSTLQSLFNRYNVNYQIEEAHNVLIKQWKQIDEKNKTIDDQIKVLTSHMDTLRNSLYEDFRPQIRMLQELQIDSDYEESIAHPLVATKKVTQVRMSPCKMQQDSQPEILPIERDNRQMITLDLPPSGPLVKVQPEIDSIVYIMKHPLMRWIKAKKNNLPYVEYTSNVEADEEARNIQIGKQSDTAAIGNQNSSIPKSISTITPSQSRAVAKKSTSKKPIVTDTTAYNPNLEMKSSHSIVYYQTQNEIQTKKFVPHKCGPHCIQSISFTPDDLKGYSPLSIPLLCGWNRQLCKYPKGKKVILYQAPCGIRLRNMEELHHYLRLTASPMSVDLFDFDYWVHCLAEFVLDKCFVNIKDLSYGVENVPIPCVNELDHALPDTIRYSTQREPTEGVNLNLDPNFLCSCDCEDDCQDKTKCQCWQLTIQGATLGGRVPNTAVGYVYKRLPEPVTTGIYECNSGCKCAVKTCLNRVVQHPLKLKLQVFKTAPRGWGIRCLTDIPLGSFICIYAGRLLTEQGANEGGKNYGDEYLAELDYVEVVEGMKEGYESDVFDPEMSLTPAEDKKKENAASDEEYNTKNNTNDSDEDFNISKYVNFSVDSNEPSIRKRLRKRKKGETLNQDGSEENSEDGSTTKSLENLSTKSIALENRSTDQDTVTISDEEENRSSRREPSRFDPSVEPMQLDRPKFKSVRDFYGEDEAVYIMDAKTTGNIGRYLNHSCDPNVFVQNVFVDTHDVRFPWVAFFALNYIRAGQELTWNYSYDVGSIPGKVIICKCGASNCRGRLL